MNLNGPGRISSPMVAQEPFQVSVFIRNFMPEDFARSAAYGEASQLQGIFRDDVTLPGTVLRFPMALNAVRACLRILPHLERQSEKSGGQILIAVDVGFEPAHLDLATRKGNGLSLLVTKPIVEYLSGQAVEFLPGPTLELDGGRVLKTELIKISPHNLGWAAPTIDVQKVEKSEKIDRLGPFGYARGSSKGAPEIHIHMDGPRDRVHTILSVFTRLPWRLILMMGFLSLALLGLQRIGTHLSKELPRNRFYQSTSSVEGQEGDFDDSKSDLQSDIEFEDEAVLSESLEQENLVEVSKSPEIGVGTIVVQTLPKDCEIYLNDEWVGSGGYIELTERSTRFPYRISVQREGYVSHTSIFNLEVGERKVLTIHLQK